MKAFGQRCARVERCVFSDSALLIKLGLGKQAQTTAIAMPAIAARFESRRRRSFRGDRIHA